MLAWDSVPVASLRCGEASPGLFADPRVLPRMLLESPAGAVGGTGKQFQCAGPVLHLVAGLGGR